MADTNRPLTDKVALVTGGSRGIGGAICKRLAEGGAHVILTYANSTDQAKMVEEACRSHQVKAEAQQVDAGDIAASKRLVASVVERHGPINILVNNAAILTVADLPNVTEEVFEQNIAVNLRGLFFLTQAVVEHMPEGGRIVNIGSIFGETAPTAGLDLYSMSKFAMAGLTRAWSRDLAPQGITVNCIQPGPVNTDMNPDDGPLAGFLTPRTAINRYGRVEEVAEMVAYLVGPNTDNVTGVTLNNDGGSTA